MFSSPRYSYSGILNNTLPLVLPNDDPLGQLPLETYYIADHTPNYSTLTPYYPTDCGETSDLTCTSTGSSMARGEPGSPPVRPDGEFPILEEISVAQAFNLEISSPQPRLPLLPPSHSRGLVGLRQAPSFSNSPNSPPEPLRKVFPCKTCGYQCDRISRLKEHRISHTGEKRFKCRHCQRRFLNKSNLKRHIKSAEICISSRMPTSCENGFTRVQSPPVLNPPSQTAHWI